MFRCLRGGSAFGGAVALDASKRFLAPEDYEYEALGFRLATPSEAQVIPEPLSVAFMGSAFVVIAVAPLRRRSKRKA